MFQTVKMTENEVKKHKPRSVSRSVFIESLVNIPLNEKISIPVEEYAYQSVRSRVWNANEKMRGSGRRLVTVSVKGRDQIGVMRVIATEVRCVDE